MLRHRKIRPCIEGCGVLFLSFGLSLPLHKYWICRNVLHRDHHGVGAVEAKAEEDKTNCLFMPFIEKISVPYDMVIFPEYVFGRMRIGLKSL